MSSSYCRRIYSEVEEVGWEHLVKLGDDLTFLSFRVLDIKGRSHILEITLDKTYPRCPPSVSADVPYNLDLDWSLNSKLRDVVHQFQRHVNTLQEFWSTLDDIDRSLWVTDPIHSHRAMSYRQIKIGNDCCLILSINVNDPLSLPESRFLGSGTTVNSLRNIWKRNCKRWAKDKSFAENLAHVFDTKLPQPPHIKENEEQVECGICYAQFLPTDDELGAKSGSETDYRCENGSCSRAFHSVCLIDWLRSITTTRQSFDVLFGNCPYCSDPIAVKISTIM
ncbi:E3 ubiquitin-protein ligase fancl [Phtheirospermum japonicum]|uniref:E3 ubiquitin-protein ligase fancl n=1 Tax=Phtheirospermum japonicum TaxID=374723 RepID=A0A830CQY9_9LAMI|nr:E3 ubiquitin-protein ligase fancl [Phtheirospermum japonicum]